MDHIFSDVLDTLPWTALELILWSQASMCMMCYVYTVNKIIYTKHCTTSCGIWNRIYNFLSVYGTESTTSCQYMTTSCQYMEQNLQLPVSIWKIIGVSLSEPHTSVTALRKCVCILACLRPYTINFKWVHLNISQRLVSCQPAVDEGLLSLLPECSNCVKETWSEDDSS